MLIDYGQAYNYTLRQCIVNNLKEMKEAFLFAVTALALSILLPHHPPPQLSTLSTYTSLLLMQGSLLQSHPSLTLYSRIYLLSDSAEAPASTLPIRLFQKKQQMTGIINIYPQFQISPAAMSAGFMELSNLYSFLGKRVLVPVEGECRGQKEERGNGIEVCQMNITVQMLIDLARSKQVHEEHDEKEDKGEQGTQQGGVGEEGPQIEEENTIALDSKEISGDNMTLFDEQESFTTGEEEQQSILNHSKIEDEAQLPGIQRPNEQSTQGQEGTRQEGDEMEGQKEQPVFILNSQQATYSVGLEDGYSDQLEEDIAPYNRSIQKEQSNQAQEDIRRDVENNEITGEITSVEKSELEGDTSEKTNFLALGLEDIQHSIPREQGSSSIYSKLPWRTTDSYVSSSSEQQSESVLSILQPLPYSPLQISVPNSTKQNEERHGQQAVSQHEQQIVVNDVNPSQDPFIVNTNHQSKNMSAVDFFRKTEQVNSTLVDHEPNSYSNSNEQAYNTVYTQQSEDLQQDLQPSIQTIPSIDIPKSISLDPSTSTADQLDQINSQIQ